MAKPRKDLARASRTSRPNAISDLELQPIEAKIPPGAVALATAMAMWDRLTPRGKAAIALVGVSGMVIGGAPVVAHALTSTPRPDPRTQARINEHSTESPAEVIARLNRVAGRAQRQMMDTHGETGTTTSVMAGTSAAATSVIELSDTLPSGTHKHVVMFATEGPRGKVVVSQLTDEIANEFIDTNTHHIRVDLTNGLPIANSRSSANGSSVKTTIGTVAIDHSGQKTVSLNKAAQRDGALDHGGIVRG